MITTDFVDEADVVAASKGQVVSGDPRIRSLLTSAQRAVRTWCGWHVTPSVTESVTLDAEGSASIQLPSTYVTDVGVVKVDGITLDPSTYSWSQDGMLRLNDGVFPDRFRCVEVTMTHGYDDDPGIGEVVIRSVLGVLSSPMGATSEQAGGVAIRWGRSGITLTVSDHADLAPFRLQRWA